MRGVMMIDGFVTIHRRFLVDQLEIEVPLNWKQWLVRKRNKFRLGDPNYDVPIG
jgi:hypothetical protein